MNRTDLMHCALKNARKSAAALVEKYTCPACRNKWLWDPDKKSCDSCGFRKRCWLVNALLRVGKSVRKMDAAEGR